MLKREFTDGNLEGRCVFNGDETSFLTKKHNQHNLSMKGDRDIKLADVVNRDHGMTMMILLLGGLRG